MFPFVFKLDMKTTLHVYTCVYLLGAMGFFGIQDTVELEKIY